MLGLKTFTLLIMVIGSLLIYNIMLLKEQLLILKQTLLCQYNNV